MRDMIEAAAFWCVFGALMLLSMAGCLRPEDFGR